MNITNYQSKSTFIKNELPQGRTLMATLGDDGDKNIYMYDRFLFQKCQSFFIFFPMEEDFHHTHPHHLKSLQCWP